MVVLRRRLIFWLIKAYIKKSKRILVISFFSGLLIFAALPFGARYLKVLFTVHRFPVIGVVGSYQKENLPPIVSSRISKGLTSVGTDGKITPELSESYSIKDDGRQYIFKLKPNLSFSDGSVFESTNINYSFSDVAIERPDKRTIVFKLKDKYSPFLATVSKPVFKKGLIGVGDYFIKSIEVNGNFVQSMILGLNKNSLSTIKFVFYPTEKSLKTAFALGEVTEASGLSSFDFKNTSFDKFNSTTIKKTVDHNHLVTLFYNVTDESLSDRKLRLALNYALPENFGYGLKAYLPYYPDSIYFNSDMPVRHQDFEHAKLLLPDSKTKLTLTTLKKYTRVAKEIVKSWEKIGISTKVIEVESVPDKYQIFLSDFNLPSDPDQYVLWHSAQSSNITKYKNLRIDKLLEDGRKTINTEERQKIYTDFQRFLLDDMPASFLYFPYSYDVIRS